MAAGESVAQPQTIIVQHRGRPGSLAGIMACIFALLGIFVSGIPFVPLAAVCSVLGLWRGIAGNSPGGIGTSLVGGFLAIIGFATSPTLWLLTGALYLAHEHDAASAPPSPASLRAQQAERDRNFATNEGRLLVRMQNFERVAEPNIAAWPAYRAHMQAITAKMGDYLKRDRALSGNPNASVARNRLYVTIMQGTVATDQLRVRVLPLKSQFDGRAVPLMQSVTGMEGNCREMLQSNGITNVRKRVCNNFLNALPAFKQDFRSLQSRLAEYDALDRRTKDEQQRIVDAAEAEN